VSEIIRIENLRKEFGDTVAVADVSLSIERGEYVTLLGPSGCGKSTVLRMIGGFETPTSGRIWLDGEDVTEVPPNKRAVNMVFQDYALFPHMTVGQNVGYGLRVAGVPRGEIRTRVAETLALVGLSEKADSNPAELSGGQKQRVALARAIARHPKVLLLDEPLSALDANLREQMQVELRILHNKVGLTFVMVTHDQSEALVMSDRVVVMRDGYVSQTGDPVSLYDAPANSYVADFIGATNLFSSRVQAANGKTTISCFGQPLDIDHPRVGGETAGEQLFGFRPEKARLIRPNGAVPEGNLLKGRLETVLYHGSTIRSVVTVGDGRLFVDMLLDDTYDPARHIGVGDEVLVSIDPHKILPFATEPAP
jgi:putative spermidine/putrescine transport system ATP-binding protein/spermidine/putrescine transport system ATP-binding protein